ncbi:MAG TPA: alpha/beta fold hydrolase [Patescibacteria group bacterium]|nr:alpha/beta fold hydrolase [Patescibacteria group bacterium]
MTGTQGKPFTVDALVPCFNEEGRVGSVLRTVIHTKVFARIIVVDDGSTDGSFEEIQQFPKVTLIRLPTNQGKGAAVKAGLEHVASSAVFLCDADLHGLTEKHILHMVGEYKKHPKCMVVGIREKMPLPGLHWLRTHLLPLIAGERVLSTDDLRNVLSHPLSSEYGLEPYMNHYFVSSKKPIIKVLLKGVNDIPKWEKKSYGLKSHLQEGINIVTKYLTLYTQEIPKEIYNGVRSFIFPTFGIDPTKYPSNTTQVFDIPIHYVKVGKGPILVFIHGWANNWEGWGPVIPYLEDDFTLYLLDLPGFGDSGDLAEYSIEKAAAYVEQFIQTLPSKPVGVIGLSMGSLVVAELGRNNPKITDSVILSGPIIKDHNLQMISQTLKYSLWFIRHIELSEIALKKIIETRVAAYAMSKYMNMYRFNRFLVDTYGMIGKKKMRRQAFTQMGISSASYNLNTVLEKYDLPALLLYGKEDKISSPLFAKKTLLPQNAHLQCIEIEEAGHVAPLEQPQKVAVAIRQFIGDMIEERGSTNKKYE